MELLKKLSREEILVVLSGGFCEHCEALLQNRIHNLTSKQVTGVSLLNNSTKRLEELWSADASRSYDNSSEPLIGSSHQQERTPWSSTREPKSLYSARPKGNSVHSSPASVNSKRLALDNSGYDILLNDGLSKVSSMVDSGLLEEDKERIRISQVGRKKDFVQIERINGKATNVLQGLELHTRVFNAEEQKKIVECVYNFQHMGQKGQLRERTYSEPRKWMRGKGRVTIQFGCCYNYALDKNGNLPGIVRDEKVDSLPPLFKQMIKRMVRWRILPPTCVPDSCIVNIYDEGDCIPPHIDHHDFARPFCTVSFLSECNILFGSNLKIVNAGEFSGPVSIPLPVGSVLILNDNGADVAKHCVPAVPARRISITFRKMDDTKLPYKFLPDPELLGVNPLDYSPPLSKMHIQQKQHQNQNDKLTSGRSMIVTETKSNSPFAKSHVQQTQYQNDKLTSGRSMIVTETRSNSFLIEKDDFPPLGSLSSANKSSINKVKSNR